MPVRTVVWVVAVLVGLSACGSVPSAPATARAGNAAGGVDQVKTALAALRRTGTATFSAVEVHRFVDSGERRELLQELLLVPHHAVFVHVEEAVVQCASPQRDVPGGDGVDEPLRSPAQLRLDRLGGAVNRESQGQHGRDRHRPHGTSSRRTFMSEKGQSGGAPSP